MTLIRCCDCKRCRLSNYFAALIDGAAGTSSFMDVDAVTHDADTKRFLVQEFKYQGQILGTPQHWMLNELSEIPSHFRVWLVIKLDNGLIDFAQLEADFTYVLHTITPDEYRELFRYWRENRRHPLVNKWQRELQD